MRLFYLGVVGCLNFVMDLHRDDAFPVLRAHDVADRAAGLGLYANPFHADVVSAALSAYGPATRKPQIYYPGSSTDVSLLDVPDSRVIHVDPNLTGDKIALIESLGGYAFRGDARSWKPRPGDFDGSAQVVAMFNPQGFKPKDAADAVGLTPGGILVYSHWGGLPELSSIVADHESSLVYAGALRPSSDGRYLRTDESPIDVMYAPKRWADLDEQNRDYFGRRVEEVRGLLDIDDLPVEQIAESVYDFIIENERGPELADRMMYSQPQVGANSVLVFKRPLQQQ